MALVHLGDDGAREGGVLGAPGCVVEVWVGGLVVFVFSVLPHWVLLSVRCVELEAGRTRGVYVSEVVEAEDGVACVGEGVH